MALRIAPLTVGPATKGVLSVRPQPAQDFLARRPHLLGGSFTFPVLSADNAAIEHNIAHLARYARDNALSLAPHGKASMAPALWQRQLDAGAWGITVATGAQAMAARSFGVDNILVANEVVDPAILRWIGAQRTGRVVFYIDSRAGLEIAGAHAHPGHPFEVVVELGHAGGRTGVRTVPDAVALARLAATIPGIRLVGVSGYEGALTSLADARAFLGDLVGLARTLVTEMLVPPTAGPMVVSAGGSAYFDAVADVVGAAIKAGLPALGLLRSGSYVVHDHGFYAQHTPFTRVPGHLVPALRLWAQVASLPEAGLAVVAAGKRDMPFDEGPPVPLQVHRAGQPPTPVAGWRMTRTNDQHSYLELEGATATALRVGDILELGISHPCTAFDKWRVIPVLDAGLVAIDLVETFF